ncbi:MAG: CCA tRNA nucleotidyltransferase [Sulfitobacter sp.]
MGRTHDILIPATTSWLNDPAALRVCDVLRDAGFEIYFVGGCVRNALLGLPDSDVDMSTNALPEQVMEIALAADLKAIPTGIDHGTVTVIVDGSAFEITTFRRDVATDGRRAVVAFSQDIEDDARRRDFTMNALYADGKGRVIDPLGGLPDLIARRIRFIEDADARIKEDYLRILRFFRFSAWYADPAEGFEADTLAAISENGAGLETLSAERIGQEMTKLLLADDPAPAVAAMRQVGALHQILLGSDDRFLAMLVHFEMGLGLAPDWVTRLAALGGEDAAMRLRLSKADARQLARLGEVGFAGPPLAEIAYRDGQRMAESALLLRACLSEEMPKKATLETINRAARAQFPISAGDLMPRLTGPALGAKLKALEQVWIDSAFSLSKEALLENL